MNKQIPDIVYLDQGIFTAFIPQTKEGEHAFNELASVTDGTGKVFATQSKQFIDSLRKAGYVVHKAKKSKELTEAELDNLLNELEL